MDSLKPTVLVVDDDTLIRDQIAWALSDCFNVLPAADGVDAARQYEGRAGQIAAVITDLRMPRLGGVTLTEWLRHINPHLPVIIMTGGPCAEGELGPLLRDPQVRLITKPFDLDKLRALLGEAIRTGREA